MSLRQTIENWTWIWYELFVTGYPIVVTVWNSMFLLCSRFSCTESLILTKFSDLKNECPGLEKTMERGIPALRKRCRKILITLFLTVSINFLSATEVEYFDLLFLSVWFSFHIFTIVWKGCNASSDASLSFFMFLICHLFHEAASQKLIQH